MVSQTTFTTYIINKMKKIIALLLALPVMARGTKNSKHG